MYDDSNFHLPIYILMLDLNSGMKFSYYHLSFSIHLCLWVMGVMRIMIICLVLILMIHKDPKMVFP